MPGHFKTIITANWIAGMRRKPLLLMATGYGLSHGLITGLSIFAGVFFVGVLERLLVKYGIFFNNFYLIILLGALIYFIIATVI
jgi:hypothetical protein